ncbi:hypothetical protein, partial [Blastococcus capsensis]
AYAINAGGGSTNPLLGCRTVSVGSGGAAPVGHLDGVAVSGSTVSARGWTLDPDVPAASIDVHVYVDGRAAAAVAADGSRPDVGR